MSIKMLFKNQKPKNYKGLNGMLLFLSMTLSIFLPIGILATSIISFFTDVKGITNQNSIWILTFSSIIESLVIIIFSIRAGLALRALKPNGDKIAKNFLVFLFLYTSFGIFSPYFMGNSTIIKEVIAIDSTEYIKTILFVGFWYTYLVISKRVKANFYPLG